MASASAGQSDRIISNAGLVIAFPKGPRGWRVRELRSGIFSAELVEAGRGVIYATGAASRPRICRFLRRARGGLDVWFFLTNGQKERW